MKHNIPKLKGCSKNSSKREIYSDTGLPHETNKKKPQINNLTLHQREQEKRNLRYQKERNNKDKSRKK